MKEANMHFVLESHQPFQRHYCRKCFYNKKENLNKVPNQIGVPKCNIGRDGYWVKECQGV